MTECLQNVAYVCRFRPERLLRLTELPGSLGFVLSRLHILESLFPQGFCASRFLGDPLRTFAMMMQISFYCRVEINRRGLK